VFWPVVRNGFAGYDDSLFSTAQAGGHRADVNIGLGDVLDGAKGRVTLYGQDLDAGYSMPGLATPLATRNYGGTFRKPLGSKAALRLKSDHRTEEQGLEMSANEIDLEYQLNEHWGVSTGIRDDVRTDLSPVVPLTQEQGKRRDGVVQMEYDSKARWSLVSCKTRPTDHCPRRTASRRPHLISDELGSTGGADDLSAQRWFGTRHATFYVNMRSRTSAPTTACCRPRAAAVARSPASRRGSRAARASISRSATARA
jgi:hypothetical protein